MDGNAVNPGREGQTSSDVIDIHQKALDDLVSVNSLFTMAVFLGLAFATPGQHSLDHRRACDADEHLKKRLVLFEVISFSFYLLSSLVAKTLKLHLNVYRENDFKDRRLKLHRALMLYLSTWGSILGCVFLMLSMVDVIQIRLGRLSCGSVYSVRAAGSLLGIVSVALLIYIPSMMHAIYVSMQMVENSKGPTKL